MKRKVAKIGSSTLMVSLPIKWVKRYGIKKGDELEIEEDKDKLVIGADKQREGFKGVVIAEEPRRLINRSIYNLYRGGADEIEVRYENLELFRLIEDSLQLLMGFEITEQGKDYCILKNVANIQDSEFDNMFRRYFLITLSLADESFEAILKKEYNSLNAVCKLENTQNKYYMFCSRAINKSGDKLLKKPNLMYLLIQRLEDIADDYKYICRYVSEIKEKKDFKLSKGIMELFKETNGYLRDLYNLYYNFDIEKGIKIINHKKKLYQEALELLENVPKKEIRIVHILGTLIVKIYESSSPIFGINLN